MKILFSIAEHYPTHRADVIVLFGKYLLRQGIQSDLLTLRDVPKPEAHPPEWPAGNLYTAAGSKRRLSKHIRSIANDLRILWLAGSGYHAVQVRDKALCGLFGLLAARCYGIRFYYWMSFPTAEAWSAFARERGLSVGWLRFLLARLRASAMRYILYRIILPRADHVFVQSDRMREKLAEKGIPTKRMTPVPMGVDGDELFGSKGARADVEPFQRPTFVYLGTLDRNRSPEVMVDAIDIVRRTVPDVRLLLIGDADELGDRIWLRRLIEERGLSEHVHTTGWLPMAEGWALARRCLAGLSPIPRGELFDVGSPTKAVEYFGLGLPVIANDQPDQEIVLAGAGAKCVPLTAQDFAAQMLKIIGDPQSYRQQGLAGQRWVACERNYEALAATVAAIYRTADAPRVPGWAAD